MNPIKQVSKDADEQKDYSINWAPLLQAGETIVASVWSVDPSSGLTVVQSAFSATATTVWVSAGANGTKYKLINRVTTDSTPARIYERHIALSISNN